MHAGPGRLLAATSCDTDVAGGHEGGRRQWRRERPRLTVAHVVLLPLTVADAPLPCGVADVWRPGSLEERHGWKPSFRHPRRRTCALRRSRPRLWRGPRMCGGRHCSRRRAGPAGSGPAARATTSGVGKLLGARRVPCVDRLFRRHLWGPAVQPYGGVCCELSALQPRGCCWRRPGDGRRQRPRSHVREPRAVAEGGVAGRIPADVADIVEPGRHGSRPPFRRRHARRLVPGRPSHGAVLPRLCRRHRGGLVGAAGDHSGAAVAVSFKGLSCLLPDATTGSRRRRPVPDAAWKVKKRRRCGDFLQQWACGHQHFHCSHKPLAGRSARSIRVL
mmetsp:Transcript_67789/g.196018  ORF Transcript_67789/g.196018 Transcript_67789/m.196018 type:complete len:332 (+) Transcript_67789:1599-2594(+)